MVSRWAASRLGGGLAAVLLMLQTATGAAASPPPAPIWSGVYAGVHGGYAWADVAYTFDTFIGPETITHSMGDWFGGGHVGVQRQFGNTVVGLEVSYSDIHLTDTVESKLLANRFRQIDIGPLFIAAVRLGYATNRWMAYVKGGYASAEVDTRVYIGGVGGGSTTSSREGGWMVGAGLEFLCWRNFRLGLEYNYVHLDIDDRSGTLPDKKPFTYTRFDDDFHTIALRLSYLFGSYVEPLK